MTATAPASTATVAEELVSLCRSGKNMDAINTLYSPDIVSVESTGSETMPRETHGIDAVLGKAKWWNENNKVNSARVEGPFLGEDKFAVYFNYDITQKASGKRVDMEEMALYTVRDGRIVHEQFFYRTS